MALTVWSAFSYHLNNLKNFAKYSNNAANVLLHLTRNSVVIPRLYTTDSNEASDALEVSPNENVTKTKKMSKAMLAYLERAKAYEEFISKEIKEFEFGKQHLANMMGQNPNTFTQDDIDNAIKYLFPSGLFDPHARPLMRPPSEVFPPQKAAAFDETGRPFSSLFYTCRANYSQLLYDIVDNLHNLNEMEDNMIHDVVLTKPEDKVDLLGSAWLTKLELEKLLLETITDNEYENFVLAMERIVDHPLSSHVKDFLMKYRKLFTFHTKESVIPPLLQDENGRQYITVSDCLRKSSRAVVTLWDNGSGQIKINGEDISYFKDTQPREQVIFPLIFTGMQDKIDVEATVRFGGTTGQSGAIRWGISWGLRSFVSMDMVEKMRIAGLLTRDYRRRERKKPGQAGARKKFTWKKR